jgi:hypothetical protein
VAEQVSKAAIGPHDRHWFAVSREVRPIISCCCLFLAALGSAQCSEFTDDPTWVHLNGYTRHFSATDCNDSLFGVGLTKYTRLDRTLITAWEADAFQDSARQLSAYVGYSWTAPTRWVSVGLTVAVMYHRNFLAEDSLGVLPVAFPYLETRGRGLKLRVYYVAPVRRASDEQVAVQLMLPWHGRAGRRWSTRFNFGERNAFAADLDRFAAQNVAVNDSE